MIEPHHLRFMQQIGRSYRALVAGFEAHIGVSMARWRIMVLLDTNGELSQKVMARTLGIDPAALTRQLKALERDGWIERHRDLTDARLTNVALTEAGRQGVQATMARRNEYIEHALGPLPAEELDALSDTLEKLEGRFSIRP